MNYGAENTFNSLPAGTHSWYAKDTAGCIYSGSSTITQPNGTVLILTLNPF